MILGARLPADLAIQVVDPGLIVLGERVEPLRHLGRAGLAAELVLAPYGEHGPAEVEGLGRGVGGGHDAEAGGASPPGERLVQEGRADPSPLPLRHHPELGEEPDAVPNDGAGEAHGVGVLGQERAAGGHDVPPQGEVPPRVAREPGDGLRLVSTDHVLPGALEDPAHGGEIRFLGSSDSHRASAVPSLQ